MPLFIRIERQEHSGTSSVRFNLYINIKISNTSIAESPSFSSTSARYPRRPDDDSSIRPFVSAGTQQTPSALLPAYRQRSAVDDDDDDDITDYTTTIIIIIIGALNLGQGLWFAASRGLLSEVDGCVKIWNSKSSWCQQSAQLLPFRLLLFIYGRRRCIEPRLSSASIGIVGGRVVEMKCFHELFFLLLNLCIYILKCIEKKCTCYFVSFIIINTHNWITTIFRCLWMLVSDF